MYMYVYVYVYACVCVYVCMCTCMYAFAQKRRPNVFNKPLFRIQSERRQNDPQRALSQICPKVTSRQIQQATFSYSIGFRAARGKN